MCNSKVKVDEKIIINDVHLSVKKKITIYILLKF